MKDYSFVLVATKTELEFITKYKEQHPERFYNTEIVFTGVGRTNTCISLAKIANDYELNNRKSIVNIGLCGSSILGSKIGDIVIPSNFKDGDRDWSNSYVEEDMYPNVSCHAGPTLITSSNFVNNTKEQAIFDMEAFDIQAFCSTFGLEFYCIKIISDFCNQDDYERMNKELFYKKFEEALNGCRWEE